MTKREKGQYVILEIGENAPINQYLKTDQLSWTLNMHGENRNNSYSQFHVRRIIPCKFERGKLYRP